MDTSDSVMDMTTPPPLTKLVRSTNRNEELTTGPPIPRVIKPFLWDVHERIAKVETERCSPNPETPLLVPKGTNPGYCYPVHLHITAREISETLENVFQTVGLVSTRNGTKYQWDVRTDLLDRGMETIIDVQLFSNEKGALTVCFNKWYGNDNWRADDLIERMAYLSGLGMIHRNKWNPTDAFPGILSK